jgi:F0F1-type ATP synthase membrane subunit b/b'
MENLGIDGKLLSAQLINFILFFIIYKKYIAKPFMAFLKKEKS